MALLSMANYKENEWEWKGKKFKVMPGQFVTSLESIRVRAGLGISIQNVRSSLNRFKKLEFLTYKSTKMGRLITIINWDGYQSNDTVGQQRTQQWDNKDPTTIEEGNKDNNKERKLDTSVSSSCKSDQTFGLFWKAYPKKKNKMTAYNAWKTHKCNLIASKIIKSVEDHIQSEDWQKEGGRFIPNPATFIRAHGWDDEIVFGYTTGSRRTDANIRAAQRFIEKEQGNG